MNHHISNCIFQRHCKNIYKSMPRLLSPMADEAAVAAAAVSQQFFSDPLLLEAPGTAPSPVKGNSASSASGSNNTYKEGSAVVDLAFGRGLSISSSPPRVSSGESSSSSVTIASSARSRRSIGSQSGMMPSSLPVAMKEDGEFWVPDTSSDECLLCLEKFDLAVRR